MDARTLSLLSRRSLLAGAAAALGAAAVPHGAFALDAGSARALIDKAVGEVNGIISSGQSEGAMLGSFEKLFARYADVPTIARSALGPAARSASKGDLAAFTKAFQGYIARKYGRRFREFIGGQIVVVQARDVPNGVEVETTAILQGQSPFRVDFQVSDRSGRAAFFNIIIEGVNMLLSERTEVQAMLDARGRNIDRLIADLPQG